MSVTSHNVGLPALEVRRPECTGYLLKIGDRHKTWRRRYCILKDACLYYYKNMNSLNALGKCLCVCVRLGITTRPSLSTTVPWMTPASAITITQTSSLHLFSICVGVGGAVFVCVLMLCYRNNFASVLLQVFTCVFQSIYVLIYFKLLIFVCMNQRRCY